MFHWTRRVTKGPEWLGMPLLTSLGFDCLRRPISLDAHVHAGFELTYISGGEVAWELSGGRRLELKGGDAAIIQPGVSHRGQWDIIRPCRLFWVVFDLSRPDATTLTPFAPAELATLDSGFRDVGDRVAQLDKATAFFFEELLRLMATPEAAPLEKPLARGLLCQILAGCWRAFTAGAEARGGRLAQEADSFIAKNLGRELDVAALAAAFQLSPAKFNGHFKRETGQTPADYIARARCAKARELLLGTRRPVTAIAFDLGFCSSQYFASVFKKYTGMSPKEFRRSGGE